MCFGETRPFNKGIVLMEDCAIAEFWMRIFQTFFFFSKLLEWQYVYNAQLFQLAVGGWISSVRDNHLFH